MNATLIIMQAHQKAAMLVRSAPKPTNRGREDKNTYRNGVRKHTSAIRDIRYDS